MTRIILFLTSATEKEDCTVLFLFQSISNPSHSLFIVFSLSPIGWGYRIEGLTPVCMQVKEWGNLFTLVCYAILIKACMGCLVVVFHFEFIFDRHFYKQTVKTLTRRRVLRRLIWVCTVCLGPGTLGMNGLNYEADKNEAFFLCF